jgi:two-component system, OmpR family, sensor kinase
MPSDAPGVRAEPTFRPLRVHDEARFTLGARVAFVCIASAVLAVLIAGAVSYPLARDAAQQQSAANLDQLADATAFAIERRPVATPEIIPKRLQEVFRSEGITVYYVAVGGSLPEILKGGDLAQLAENHNIDGVRQTMRGTVLFSARPLTTGGVVVLTQSLVVASRLTVTALSRFALALGIGVVIAAIFGFLLAQRLTRPLREAADAAKRMSQGDRDVELEVQGPSEIAEVAEALNELRHALTLSEGRQRDFLLSVSHELRTPLTAIRGYAEAIADGVVQPEHMARTGAILQAESDRLDLLVADLLELARLDARDVRITPVELDFNRIGQQAADVWRDRCSTEGLVFRTEISYLPLAGESDPTRVRQIIDNLCANALRVTPAGQPMVLAIRAAGARDVDIEVRDGGPGLTPDDCAVAFEPAELYSRYQGVRKVGTGVGLALVGRLAKRLGGEAHAGAATEGGARFTIRIARHLGK